MICVTYNWVKSVRILCFVCENLHCIWKSDFWSELKKVDARLRRPTFEWKRWTRRWRLFMVPGGFWRRSRQEEIPMLIPDAWMRRHLAHAGGKVLFRDICPLNKREGEMWRAGNVPTRNHKPFPHRWCKADKKWTQCIGWNDVYRVLSSQGFGALLFRINSLIALCTCS